MTFSLDSNRPESHLSRSNAYIKAGQLEEAVDDFKQVLSMTEEEDVIQRARRALKDLKDADYR